MATIPSFESIVLEVHKSLGLESPDKKKELIRLERRFEDYLKIIPELIEEIFNALGMDAGAKHDAMIQIESFASFNNTIELNTWTYGADSRQVVWFLSGYSYAPWLGRTTAFWSIAAPLDKGMPSGSFWYLPEIRDIGDDKVLVLPLAQVVDWLMDILGQSMDAVIPHLGGGESSETGKAKIAKVESTSIEKTLYNWKTGTVPHVSSIEKYFAEGTELNFKGALCVDSHANQAWQFQTVLDFIKHKNLNASKLHVQIPLDLTLITKILNDRGDDEEVKHFIALMQDRYSAPSLRTIRQRLLVARATQDAYIRLGELFSGSDFNRSSTDISQNKVLQLFGIFKASYNWTMEAFRQCDGEAAEDSYFENSIPSWDRLGIFLSVLPSRRQSGCMELANKLSRIFAASEFQNQLEDHIGHDEASTISVAERNVLRLNLQDDEDVEVQSVLSQLKTYYLPWSRILQAITSYRVAYRIALSRVNRIEIRRLAVDRVHELAITPQDILGAIKIELSQLLDEEDRKTRSKDAKIRVAQLIEESKANSAYEIWKPIFLHYEAKHHLSFNDFEIARCLFEEALEACHQSGFGRLRGVVARDALAIHIERQFNGYALGNLERYYRNMLAYGGLHEGEVKTLPLFEDVARDVSDYFWKHLYFPYRGEKVEQPLAMEISGQFIDKTTSIIWEGDWIKFNIWLKNNSKLKDKRLKEVRGQTVLIVWINMLYLDENAMPAIKARLPVEHADDFIKHSNFLKNWRIAICLLIERWPKLVMITDFKKQTPLMLAANQGDFVIVDALLKAQFKEKSKACQQDFKGRTALHAAVFGQSLDCVLAVLAQSPELAKIKGNDTQSILHIAVSIGSPEIVRALIKHTPELKDSQNSDGLTAFDLAKELCSQMSTPEDMRDYQNYMAGHGRKIGSLDDFKEVYAMLLE